MDHFEKGSYLPRAAGSVTWRPLLEVHGQTPEQLIDNPIDLRQAEFHPAATAKATESQLLAWRKDMNAWAYDRGFPAPLDQARRSLWDVELGQRLVDDIGRLPESRHPHTWCWLATNLLPHFVVYRWGWPEAKGADPPTGRAAWARFGTDLRNGLRLAMHRILTYGPDLTRRASEQEFQSIQYRPAFGLDQRVARVALKTLVESYDDPDSNYGKNGSTRSDDADTVCIELRLINSLRPLCFATDTEISELTADAIQRLPELRAAKPYGSPVNDE